MDNLAHSLVGLAAAKAGLEKLSPGATAVSIIAANAPDLDFIAAISGDRWTVLHYHRGITHSIPGIVLLGLIIPALFCLGDRALARARERPARLRFLRLLLVSLVVGATHPLLDWTNNYGVRPLLPWSGRWFYGDLVFVVDPVLWLVFGAAAFWLTSNSRRKLALWSLLGGLLTVLVVYATVAGRAVERPTLVLSWWVAAVIMIVIGFKWDLGRRVGRKAAVTAFLLVLAYWGGLSFLHDRALARTAENGVALASEKHEQVRQLAAMPTLANPMHWRCVVETDRAEYRFDVYLTDAAGETKNLVRFEQPKGAAAELVKQARRDRRAQLFFEFARFPVARVADTDCTTQTLVQFADLRYTEPGKARGSFALDVPVECPGPLRTDNGR